MIACALILSEPTFISSYRFDATGYAYFFFRESSVENEERKVLFFKLLWQPNNWCRWKVDIGKSIESVSLWIIWFLRLFSTEILISKAGVKHSTTQNMAPHMYWWYDVITVNSRYVKLQVTGENISRQRVVTPLELMVKRPKVLFESEQSSRYRVFEISRVDCMCN